MTSSSEPPAGSDSQLPYGMTAARPHHARQISLFPERAAEVWLRLGISQAVVERWRTQGWTGLPSEPSSSLQGHDVMELQFLRDWEQQMPPEAASLLSLLDRPYRYDLSQLVFSSHGWLMLDTPEQLRWTLLDELELWFPDLARRQPEFVAEVLERIERLIND